MKLTMHQIYHKYSLLVRQFGINAEAYEFWTALSEQFGDALELYEKHPKSTNSNIKNVNNEDELVLGYFNTATVKEKRAFVERDWSMFVPDYCEYSLLPEDKDEWLSFGYFDSRSRLYERDSACFDCTARGGTNIKPDFWED